MFWREKITTFARAIDQNQLLRLEQTQVTNVLDSRGAHHWKNIRTAWINEKVQRIGFVSLIHHSLFQLDNSLGNFGWGLKGYPPTPNWGKSGGLSHIISNSHVFMASITRHYLNQANEDVYPTVYIKFKF